jgi:hypothetical protein
MRAVASNKKAMLALALALVLGVFLPPNINGKRFQQKLAATLSDALGRHVKIGSVSYRLLPRPGFDVYDLEVDDDPAFSAEPLLRCGRATADLRLTSLWQGRLEIANLKLQYSTDAVPPSLNLVYRDGHWNLESLIARVEQVPTAPTAKKSAERRSRFPYIEAEGGRINLKSGLEKKPYALIDTDFGFWLAAEDVWHFRLRGRPVRADMDLSDTGRIKVEGDFKRASDWRQTPVQLQASWIGGQLGQISRLATGHDQGWRGGFDAKTEAAGTFQNLKITTQADLQNFRRYDINRRGMFTLTTRCIGGYGQGMLEFDCGMPLETGGVRLRGKLAPSAPANYDLSLVANRVPISALIALACHAKRTLPDDLSATGQLDAAFAFHGGDNIPQDWHGTGSTSALVLRSLSASTAVQVPGMHFHLGGGEEAQEELTKGKRPGKKIAPTANPRSLVIDPFAIQLGSGVALQAQGEIGGSDYMLAVKGIAPLERVLDVGIFAGFPSHIGNTAGTADLNLDMHGRWADFAPAQLGGTAHLENVTAAIPGVSRRLLLPKADVHFGDTDAVLVASSQFEDSPVAFTGSVTAQLNCPQGSVCPLQFNLQAESLNTQDVADLLGIGQAGWKLPFMSAVNQVPDIRAVGGLSVAHLVVDRIPLEKFIAHLEIGDHTLAVDRATAKLADGSLQADWSVDWKNAPARYKSTGTMTGVSLERFPLSPSASSILASWIAGKARLNYSLEFVGLTMEEMLLSARGSAEFTVPSGVSQALTLESRPTRFQALQGRCEFKNRVLELPESKFKAENRIYDVSGTVSLADNQAKLKVNNHVTQWEITGELQKPKVAAQHLTAQISDPAQSR